MTAFAANSVLCRLALGSGAVDAASFTSVRIASGAAALLLISRLTAGQGRIAGSWASAAMLFLYAVAFSFAYRSLPAGTGALILFGSVQATMILAGLRAGERPRAAEWVGLAVALAGLVYLVLPGVAAPSLVGSLLMALAGVAWGVYSLRGRGATDALSATTGNFLRAVPLTLLASALGFLAQERTHASAQGVAWAVASGAVASGVGYVIWYAALRGLSATRAATVQLTVPVIAALGGVVFLAEEITLRLGIAAVLILGGVALAVPAKDAKPDANSSASSGRRRS